MEIRCLEESLILELSNPSLSTVLGHIVLVVLVAHKSNEFSVNNSLGFSMVVSISGGESVDFASLSLEKVVKLTSSITEVFTI